MFRLSYIVMEKPSSFDPPEEFYHLLTYLRELNYEGVELNLTEPPGFDPDRLEHWLTSLNLAVPSFLTGEAYRQGLCLSAPDLSVRRRTVDRLISYLATARRFGAVLVVGLLQGLRQDEPNTEAANDRIAGCLREVAAAAEELGVEVVMEPVNHLQTGFNNSVRDVRRLIDRVGSPALKPMVDTLHMNIEETSLIQPILDFGSELRHVHLCESNGSVFGGGHINFAAVWEALREIGYQRFISVKVYRGASAREGARSSMEYLQNLARRELPLPE